MFRSLKLLWAVALVISITLALATSSPVTKREPTCNDIVIPVTISATNAAIPAGLTFDAALAILVAGITFPFTVAIQGTYNISARYCEPEVYYESRHNTLQLLVHGITYTKNYWSGDGPPGGSFGGGDQYSWVSYASTQGYPTLAIDRLGNGNSTHPDPSLAVQSPAQVEVLHQLVTAARAGSIPSTRSFTNIILAGHSYGSFLCNSLNTKYPKDVNATILTGFTSTFKTAIPGILPYAGIVPADVFLPSRFGNLPPGYLEFGSQSGAALLLFYGPGTSYDTNLFNYDYSIRGTVTIGELLSIPFAATVAPDYTNPVYIVTGQHDFAFCNPLGIQPSGDCGPSATGYLEQTKVLYPAASNFSWYAPPTAGHCWHLHYDAAATFPIVHQWIAGQGF